MFSAFLVPSVLIFLVIESACGGAAHTAASDPPAQSPAPAPSPNDKIPAIGHVAVVVLENQQEDKILNNPNMPYMTSLATQNAYAAQCYADVHPSLGNYFMLTTGQNVSNDLNFGGVKPQFVSNTFYQHESLLRAIDDALQLPYEGNAATAPSMAEFFVSK